MRILVAEDDPRLLKSLVHILEMNKFSAEGVDNGVDALDYASSGDYDGLVLDIMMPGMDGLEVLRAVRKKGLDLPIMFLTARDSIADRVTGLDTGADDYLIKPFDFDELLARIRSMTRKRSSHTSSVLTVGDLTLDTGSHTARRGDRVIDLSAREYAILEYLCMNPGIVLSREKIENHIWNYDYSGGTNVVDVYISYLRKKIDGGCDKKLIRTVWGAGWMIKEAE